MPINSQQAREAIIQGVKTYHQKKKATQFYKVNKYFFDRESKERKLYEKRRRELEEFLCR